MSYSGNPTLSSEVKQRILSTFDQTLDLARDGNRQEALLGCDFVLRMDPQFQPAQRLQERLKSSTGPVSVDDLQGGGAAAGAPPDDPFGDLDGLSLELPPELPGDSTGFLREELESLIAQRRFQDMMALAEREQSTIALHPELRRIVGAAQERMEAEPYVLKFLNSARQALQLGQDEEAARLLDKARSLDPEHPGIAAVDRERSASAKPMPEFRIPPPLESGAVPVSLEFGGGDSESDRRIQELLDEGQTALQAGDPQSAIDAWSRIFLIDIDHQEASRRIEAARKLKAESERQVEEIFHDGLARLEAGDVPAARQAFEQVLEIQPAYFAAREYLQQLDAGNIPTVRPANREMPAAEPSRALTSELHVPVEELKEEILVPPEPGERPVTAERRPAKRMVAAKDTSRARRLFLIVGGAVLLLAVAGAWFVYQNRERFFPNSQPEVAPSATAQSTDPIVRAERLHKAGKTAIALNQLRRIPATDPQYQQAQKLIAEWTGTDTASTGASSQTPLVSDLAPPPPLDPQAVRRQALLASARQLYGEGSNLRALRRLQQAGAMEKLAGEDATLLTDVQRNLAPLNREIEYFRQHEWELILRDLWIKHEAAPGDRDVTQLLVDCSYNLAVRDLQRNDATKAAGWLADAVKLQPDDDLLRRQYLFAQTYQERPKDLLYKIYVKYLPFR